MFILREMRHESEFYLAVVGTEEQTTLVRDDGFTNEASALRTDRQVLQVRIGTRETSGRRHGLVIGRVDLSVLSDITRECSDIGGNEFLQFAVVEDLPYYLVFLFECDEHLLGRGVLSGLGFLGFRIEFEFVEEQFAYLPRTVDIKGFTRQFVDTLLKCVQFRCECSLSLFEFGYIHPHTCRFHLT